MPVNGTALLADTPELRIPNSLRALSGITAVLMPKVSPVLMCGSQKPVTPQVGFGTALPAREEDLPALLEPFPSCLHFLTRIFWVPVCRLWHAQCAVVWLAGGWAFKGQEGLCCQLCKMAENMACPSCSSTTSSIPEMMKKCIIHLNQEKVQH